MKPLKVAVYGDIIVDSYLFGTSTRISPEAPVPVIDYLRTEVRPGGAANVFANLNSLMREDVTMRTINEGEDIVKQRIFCDNHMIARIDFDKNKKPKWCNLPPKDSDIVVVSDYDKGAVSASLFSKIKHIDKIIVDPKKRLSYYQGLYCVKPNLAEFNSYIQKNISLDKKPGEVVLATEMRVFANDYDIEHLIVTLGDKGVAHYEKTADKIVFHQPHKVDVFDVTGAGDTFTAVLAYGLATHQNMHDAITLANKAAAVAVSKVGTYIIKPSDLQRETIVFTNGCFDILHAGHVDYLQKSKNLGTKLIVGINSDRSIRELKGPQRPIINQDLRKKILESLKFVDEVIVFDESTPIELIKQIKPDIITKGDDYKEDEVVGKELARVVLIPRTEGCSTTNIINKVLNGN